MGAFLVSVSCSSFQLEIANEWKYIKFLFLPPSRGSTSARGEG
jgi:hypothetical protein